MAEMLPPLRNAATRRWDSRYARMVPGNPGIPPAASNSRPRSDKRTPELCAEPNLQPRAALRRRWTRILFPHPQTADTVVLYQLTILDLLVLLASGLVLSALVPALSLPHLAMPAYAVLVILFAFSEGIYQNVGAPLAGEAPILTRSAVFAMALVLTAEWNEMQPLAALTAVVVSLTGLVLWRQLRRRGWDRHFSETEPRIVLIVGASHTGRAIAQALREDPLQRALVAGFLDDKEPLSPHVLGRIGDLDWLAREQFIDEVILAVPHEPALVREAANMAFRNHLDIKVVPDLPPGAWPEAGVERIGGIPVIALHHERLPSAALLLKRFLDVGGAFLGLALIAPVMGVLALLIRLDSPGQIFYAAERTGAKGRPFRCYKFRSMTAGADQIKETLRGRNQREGPIFKVADDPRVTRLGRALRRYSLDELPQLWNVLRGEMSLVGPRPHPVDEVNHYELHHYRRLDMKPGMTGLWQVTARTSPSFDLNMHLDLTYIENWTLLLDLHILLKTVGVLFSPQGA